MKKKKLPEMSVRECAIKLQDYFMKQDHEQLARLCANLLIDINRQFTRDKLTDHEKIHLDWRTRENLTDLYKFLLCEECTMNGLFLRNIKTDEESE